MRLWEADSLTVHFHLLGSDKDQTMGTPFL